MTTYQVEQRVWIGSLERYNAGQLIGRWFDMEDYGSAGELEQAARDHILRQCGRMAQQFRRWASNDNGRYTDPTEELWIFDHEGLTGSEMGIGEAWEQWEILEALPEDQRAAFQAYADHIGTSYANADNFEEAFNGEWRSEQEFAEELIDDIEGVDDDSISGRYFDYEAFTRDLFMGDYFSVQHSGGVWVFRSIWTMRNAYEAAVILALAGVTVALILLLSALGVGGHTP